MSDSEVEKKSAQLEPKLSSMQIGDGGFGEEGGAAQVKEEDSEQVTPALNDLPTLPKSKSRSTSHSPSKQSSPDESPTDDHEQEEVVGGDITLKMEPGKAPKLSRTATQKIRSKPPLLFLDLPDATEEARRTFVTLPECTYGAKYMGTTEHALECDCSEEWGMYSAQILSSSRKVFRVLIFCRLHHPDESRLWRRFRLYQPRHQDGMCRRL